MSIIFYNIFLLLYRCGIHIASVFNNKAARWVAGRKGVMQQLESSITPGAPIIWMHCASLGEFEQGRPVLEDLKHKFPSYRILLTFFSPSGYEAQKDYEHADWVFYMPLDGASTARKFLGIVKPSLVIFVKYEFWFYYLKKIKYRNIPLILISAIFREHMTFFKWYGALQRKMLSRFDHIFVQDKLSLELAKSIGLSHICSVSGDTRFDRVIQIAEKFLKIPGMDEFIAGEKTIVAGSTWPEDESLLYNAMDLFGKKELKLIIAPHEINDRSISRLKHMFADAVLFSEAPGNRLNARVLIIDNIGMLSRLYHYGYLAFVGGGSSSTGVHNVLEAAVYYKPVLFGSNYQKYSEAVGLVESGGGFPVSEKNGERMLFELLRGFIGNEGDYTFAAESAGKYVRKHTGATRIIISYIQEKRLLTS